VDGATISRFRHLWCDMIDVSFIVFGMVETKFALPEGYDSINDIYVLAHFLQ
jgi:hypothetical protein